MLDDQIISAPSIQSPILSGAGVITGGVDGFTPAEAEYLVRMLRAGSLPARLGDEPISERTVAPRPGADSRRVGMITCVLGLLLVNVLFVVYYYYRAWHPRLLR